MNSFDQISGAALALVSRLENKDHRALQIVAVVGQQPRRSQKRRHMGVVSLRVGQIVRVRAEGKPRVLAHFHGVHLSPERERTASPLSAYASYHAGIYAEPLDHFHAGHGREYRFYPRRSEMFVQPRLGKLMKVSSPRHQLARRSLRFGEQFFSDDFDCFRVYHLHPSGRRLNETGSLHCSGLDLCSSAIIDLGRFNIQPSHPAKK
jgi:hypothetical protein